MSGLTLGHMSCSQGSTLTAPVSCPPQVAPLLVHVSSFAATSHKKKLYVIGGGPNGKLATDKTQCYDPLTNKWTLKSPMPVEAKCINAVSFRDRIYVVGEWLMASSLTEVLPRPPAARLDIRKVPSLGNPGWCGRGWCRPGWNFPRSPRGGIKPRQKVEAVATGGS